MQIQSPFQLESHADFIPEGSFRAEFPFPFFRDGINCVDYLEEEWSLAIKEILDVYQHWYKKMECLIVMSNWDGIRAMQRSLWPLRRPFTGTTGSVKLTWTWIEHAQLQNIVALWNMVQIINLHLHPNQEDKVAWKLTAYGEYTRSSAYNAQLMEHAASQFWPPFGRRGFHWSASSSRVYLQIHGSNPTVKFAISDSNLICCHPCTEPSVDGRHADKKRMATLVSKIFRNDTTSDDGVRIHDYIYTRRIWTQIINWTKEQGLQPARWRQTSTPLEWWPSTTTSTHDVKAFQTLSLMISWGIWMKRNRWVFNNNET